MLARLLFPALALAAPALSRSDDSEVARRPLAIRIHSLAGLVESSGHDGGELLLLPSRMSSDNNAKTDPDEYDGSGPALMSPEDLVSLVREVIDPQVWEDGTARIDLAEERRLVVTAPNDTQDRIAAFLERLASTFTPDTTLSVKVLGGGAIGDSGTTIDSKAADKLEEQMGVVRRAQLSLIGRGVSRATSFLSGSAVFDWQVEIAQGGAISDPVIAPTRIGLEVSARAVPAEGGMYVALMLRQAEQVADPSTRIAEGSSQIVAQQMLAERPAGGLLQHPRLGFVSFAGTCFVPSGKTLLMPVQIATHLGQVGFTLALRFSGDVPPARTTFDVKIPGEGDPLSLGFVSRGLLALGGVEIWPIPSRTFDSGWSRLDVPGAQAVLTGADNEDRALDLANLVAAPVLESGRGSLTGCGVYVRALLPNTTIDDVANAIATFDSRGNGEISGRVLEGETELGRFRVPYVDGRMLTLWAGAQGARVADWDVDVANEAQIPNPTIESWVDGFAINLRVTRDARGRAVLRANGVVNLLEGEPTKLELRDQSHLAIEPIRARRTSFDETRVVAERTARTTIGGDLSIELEVKSR